MNTVNSFLGDLPVFFKTSLITVTIILFYLRVKELIILIKTKRSNNEHIERLKYGGLSKKDLHDYTPFEFEHWCAEFLEKQGFTHIEITPFRVDNGEDIICRKGTETYLVECKRFNFNKNSEFKVDMGIIRKLIGTMEGSNVHNGIIITTGYAENEAAEYVKTLPDKYKVQIIDGDELINKYEAMKNLIYVPQKIN